jgi:sporulation protein YlmC with PRC-barrel domain
MRIKHDTKVTTLDAHDAGHVDRVVLDPVTKEVTHLVIRKGFLFSEDTVVPIDLVGAADENGIQLRVDSERLRALPAFEETHYVRVDEEDWPGAPGNYGPPFAPALYWYPPLAGGPPPIYLYDAPPGQPVAARTEKNIPEGEVAVKHGAKVIAADGERVGSVEAILTDPKADRATDLVVSQGLITKDKKRVKTRCTWQSVRGWWRSSARMRIDWDWNGTRSIAGLAVSNT